MAGSSDLRLLTRGRGFQSRRNANGARKPPPAQLSVYPCQETPPSTGGNFIAPKTTVSGCELDTPPKSDEDEQKWPTWGNEGRAVQERAERLTAVHPGPEVLVHETESTSQFVGTGAAELNDYLGGFTLRTNDDRHHAIAAGDPHAHEDKLAVVCAAGIMLNFRSAKLIATGMTDVARGDSAFNVVSKHGTENGDSEKVRPGSPRAPKPSRNLVPKAEGQNSLTHPVTADYAYRGPFFVRNISTFKIALPGSGTSSKKKGTRSSGSNSLPARATLAHLEDVPDAGRHRPTPAAEQRPLNDIDLKSGASGDLSSSDGDSKDRSDRLLGLTKDTKPRFQTIPGIPGRTMETKTQHRMAKRGTAAGPVFSNTSATQKDGVPIISGTFRSESHQYNLHDPAVSSRLLRRLSSNETGMELMVGPVTKLSLEEEQTRTADIWSFFAFLICNLRCEGIIQEDEYHERALWRTCVSLVQDNGCLAVFARMDDRTMVALGVPVSLIPRVWKDLLVWTLADGGSEFAPDECEMFGMNYEEDARSFVTWGSDDD